VVNSRIPWTFEGTQHSCTPRWLFANCDNTNSPKAASQILSDHLLIERPILSSTSNALRWLSRNQNLPLWFDPILPGLRLSTTIKRGAVSNDADSKHLAPRAQTYLSRHPPIAGLCHGLSGGALPLSAVSRERHLRHQSCLHLTATAW